ncbi:hypothetical protein [Methylobacterium sp. OAE515]|uniref:hypothetical protein n=1 Tax=Methylobacterium sp. OAE515 TaxID=2817895 RepID=UPI00178BE16F
MSYDPKFDGLKIFVADISLLRTGDVLLTRNRMTTSLNDRRQADIISVLSGGNFSHALLCTGSPTFIEAVGLGVSNLSLQNCYAHNLTDVRLLRHHDDSIASAAGNWALTRLGQNYSVRLAFESILPSKIVPREDRGTFCSALVATAYRAVGAREFADSDPLKITPATLEHSSCFHDVTNTVFKQILAPRNAERMSALDGDRSPSPVSEQAFIHAEIYAAIFSKIHDIVLRYNLPGNKIPDTFMDVLLFIVELRKVGKYRDAPQEFQRDIDLLDVLLREAMSRSRLEMMLYESIKADDNYLERTIRESFDSKPDLDVESLRSMLKATMDQIARRGSIMDNADYPRGLSQAWDLWLDLTERSLSAFAVRRQVLEETISRLRA